LFTKTLYGISAQTQGLAKLLPVLLQNNFYPLLVKKIARGTDNCKNFQCRRFL